MSGTDKALPVKIWVDVDAQPAEGEPVLNARTADGGTFDPPYGLVFVPAGDAALTRLLKPLATCEVMQKRYKTYPPKRIGLLVEPSDLAATRRRLEETRPQREANRVRERDRREKQEEEYRARFREETVRLYPRIPQADLDGIVALATEVGSGRVGRSGKLPLTDKVKLAVRAHVRHTHTDYDEKRVEFGWDRQARELARELAARPIEEILNSWRGEEMK